MSRRNPASWDVEPRDLAFGVRKYVEFHDLDPKDIGPLELRAIPERVYYGGTMIQTMYASKKWEDRMNGYYHDHDDGVKLYFPVRVAGATARTVPWSIAKVKTFVKLGRCIKLHYRDLDGKEFESVGNGGSELYCTPSGKALLVIQDKKYLEAMIWGGKLDVQARGIVH